MIRSTTASPHGAVMREINGMNMEVEHRTLVLASQCSTTEPHRLPINLIIIKLINYSN